MTRQFATACCLAVAAALVVGAAGCGRSVSADVPPDRDLVAQLRAGGEGASAGGAATAEKATGSGWGTLKGVFVFDGQPPAAAFLSTGGKDAAVCGAQVPNQSLVVDPSTKGVADILIFARKVSRVFQPPEGAAAASQAVFDQKNCLFLSHVFAMQTKDTLVLKNSDPISHNTSLNPPGQPSTNPLLAPNAEATYKFGKQLGGPVDATCSIHPWMKAYIVARDDPYFAVTKPDGSFEIKNVPAGEEIEFQVWHERAMTGLQAKPGWSKGRFKITVPADGEQDLQVIPVPAAAFN